MSRFTEEQLEFLQKYIELGKDQEGLPYISSVICDVGGDVFGKIGGSVYGRIDGDVFGKIGGFVCGTVHGGTLHERG